MRGRVFTIGMDIVIEPKPAPKLGVTELAENRTEMGFGRTLLALERTLMAWIRTDISLITFGFTMYKFLDGMRQASGTVGNESGPRTFGLALILIGIGTLVMAMIQFKRAMRRILIYTQTKPQPSISMMAGIALLILAVAMILNMFGIGKF